MIDKKFFGFLLVIFALVLAGSSKAQMDDMPPSYDLPPPVTVPEPVIPDPAPAPDIPADIPADIPLDVPDVAVDIQMDGDIIPPEMEGMMVQPDGDSVEKPRRFMSADRYTAIEMQHADLYIPVPPQESGYKIPAHKKTIPADQLHKTGSDSPQRPQIVLYDWDLVEQLGERIRREDLRAEITVIRHAESGSLPEVLPDLVDEVKETLIEAEEEIAFDKMETVVDAPVTDELQIAPPRFPPQTMHIHRTDPNNPDIEWNLHIDKDDPNLIRFSYFDGESWRMLFDHRFESDRFTQESILHRIRDTLSNTPASLTREEVETIVRNGWFGNGNINIFSLSRSESETGDEAYVREFKIAAFNVREVLGDRTNVEEHNKFIIVSMQKLEDGEWKEYKFTFWLLDEDIQRAE